MLAAVSWETVGVFGGFVVAAIMLLGAVGVRMLEATTRDATRIVIKEEVSPVLERHDKRLTIAELELVDQKVALARLQGIEEGRKQAKAGE